MERKLTNFTCPREFDRDQKYRIGFAYYDNGKWTGISEDTELTVDEFYTLLKPKLTLSFNPPLRG